MPLRLHLLAALGTLAFALAPAQACESPGALGGTELVKSCDPDAETCVPGTAAVHAYAEAYPDTDAELSVALTSSPWHFYDPEGRILSVAELVALLQPHVKPATKQVMLLASWAGGGEAPLAPQVADGLGLPVQAPDGFLWLAADGSTRITKQAYTVRRSGFYQVVEGEDVMVALTYGWAVGMEDRFIADNNPRLLRDAAIGWEVFQLCREKSLAGFELAARHGDAVSAYNAAIMRLEADSEEERAAALALLERAVELGDEKSRTLLAGLRTDGN